MTTTKTPDTNSPSEMHKRLVNLLPADLLRQDFGLEGTKEKMIEDYVSKTSRNDIFADVLRSFGCMRQHIRFFEHSIKDLSSVPSKLLSSDVKYFDEVFRGPSRVETDYLLKYEFTFIEVQGLSARRVKMHWLWPVKVIITSKHLEVRSVIMETRADHVIREKQEYFRMFTGSSLDELIISKEVLQTLKQPEKPLDLNRGIKKLWEDGEVDASRMRVRDIASVEDCKMDPGQGVRVAYPKRFKELLTKALIRMLYYPTKKNGFPKKFILDPDQGYIAFLTFPAEVTKDEGSSVPKLNKKSVDLLVDAIMKGN